LAGDRAVQNLCPLSFGSVRGQAVDAGGGVEAFGGVQGLRGAGEVTRLQIQRVGGIHVALRGNWDTAAAHHQRGAIAERRIGSVPAGEPHAAVLDVGRHRHGDEASACDGDTGAEAATTCATQYGILQNVRFDVCTITKLHRIYCALM
jgi:hypothetical protein